MNQPTELSILLISRGTYVYELLITSLSGFLPPPPLGDAMAGSVTFSLYLSASCIYAYLTA